LFKYTTLKTVLFSLIFAISIFTSYAQTLSDKDFVGKWKVVGTKDLSNKNTKEEAETIVKAKKIFEKVIFTFGADKKFAFEIAVPELQIKSAYWSLKTKEGIINVTETKTTSDKNFLMQIMYKKQGDEVIFALEEMPFLLIVEKL
jgi:hypothetical protein